ncbi:MAG: TraG family conjugative transposon ATPase, partial [Muribaculaceae bacterium]|nr:TraG family conjugative transposon ATPase [Muribaculaceae bacterium]
MAKQPKKILDGLFAQLEETDGNVVLFDAKGAPSVIFEMTNPVLRLCTDSEQYLLFQDVLANITQTLGEGYALQKQDIFCRQKYHFNVSENTEFLTRSYFNYFEGREFTEITTYLIITQEAQRGQFVQYDPKKWLDFHSKVSKVDDILTEKNIRHRKLTKPEVNEYIHRFMAFHFQRGAFSMTNFKSSDEYLRIGKKVIRSYPLVDIDEINLPSVVKPFTEMSVNGYPIATDLFSFLAEVPHADCVVFNQVVQIPNQRKLLRKLQGKAKRHGSMPDPSNKIAKADIEEVLNILAVDSSLLVNTNFNIIVSCPADKVTPVTSFLETKLYECGIMPSRTAYNQLELFIDSFPGNAYSFNPDYDLFLTLSDAALCLCFKEHLKECEDTPLTTFYTDRQGLPVCIDITGKEGKTKMTDNANFFCIGPSGSGKSFHMNSVVRQLLEQNTDVVMVDTGDSYEGICGYFGGTYISYSKEKPISMNPFKVTKEEYDLNFGEKKNFLKSLIFLIFKGNETPSKIEDMLVNQTIVEYYEAYFNPFDKFTDVEREGLRRKLLVDAKMEDDYDQYAHDMEDIEEQINREPPKIENRALILPSEERRLRLLRQCRAFRAIVLDNGATEAEKEKAAAKLEIYKKELHDNSMLIKIDKQIDHIEEQKRRLKVSELSFNSYYEFALERIPQITSLEKVHFDIRDFAAILKQFYRGGELEMTLNSDLDASLFDERFIVFEIDKIKDDPVLFPIVVLIIMDVFLQKMRIKKGRKALIIEEAWKAIASPTMAEYIKFLYKTVRKFHGIAGVVTQELNDVIDSPIVKEAIINNSDVKILLDQSKFKDRYDDISAILGLTPIQKQQ